MDGKIIYLALRVPYEGHPDVLGVFDSPEKADAACRIEDDGYGPLTMNEFLDEESIDLNDWEGFVFPRLPRPDAYVGDDDEENPVVDHDSDDSEPRVDMVG